MKEAFEKILERLDEMIHPKQLHFCKCARGRCRLFYNNKNCMDCVVKDAKEIVQEVAEEYKGGWIPCSERLPEESGEYLTISKIYFVPDHVDEIDNYVGVKISHYSTRYGWLDDEVIAWQPLPEPYQPKGE